MGRKVNITLIIAHNCTWQTAKLWQNAKRRAAIFSQFWSCVISRADPSRCWLYAGPPILGFIPAPAFAWWASRGPLVDGTVLEAVCGQGACVNPAHWRRGCEVIAQEPIRRHRPSVAMFQS